MVICESQHIARWTSDPISSNEVGTSSQVYAANALMEWQSERADKIPRNIFELGLKSFLGSAGFVLAYADWLLSINDVDNARQLFERALAAVADTDARPDPDLQPRIWERYIQVGALNSVT